MAAALWRFGAEAVPREDAGCVVIRGFAVFMGTAGIDDDRALSGANDDGEGQRVGRCCDHVTGRNSDLERERQQRQRQDDAAM
ncbi:hypothetical protein [Phenylobacterium sp.]|uniref:hypothetical protein n=1 Tax=Phenylobacterium sp. TaxID=1871053 RepID=UPI002729AD20|nr:hypothetical protein [Phenylobacterium sp.]